MSAVPGVVVIVSVIVLPVPALSTIFIVSLPSLIVESEDVDVSRLEEQLATQIPVASNSVNNLLFISFFLLIV